MQLNVCQIRLPRLGARFVGYRIAQISDIHLRRNDRKLIARIIASLAGQPIDLVALTGDIVHKEKFLPTAVPVLERLFTAVKPADGFVGILGNHDRLELVSATANMPVRWLINESLQIHRDAEVLNIVGLDQQHRNRADLPQALRHADPAGVVILLAHYPFALLHALYAHVDLVLAGHTHGGQIRLSRRLPYFTNDRLGWRFGDGLVGIDGTQMYVTRGVGLADPIHMRIAAPAEVTILELQGTD